MDLDDVARTALALDDVVEVERRGGRAWARGRHVLAWERPFSGADLRRFGSAPVPPEPVLGVRLTDLHEKEAVLAEGHPGVLTIPHLDGYPAVLVSLPQAQREVVRELLLDAWRAAGGG